MKKFRNTSIGLLFILNLFTSVSSHATYQNDSLLDNFIPFIKLYGYVRFFHPSDEAAKIDWDKFAVYGIRKVKSAKNKEELKNILKELFLPIAPTAQIYSSVENPKEISEYLPKDSAGLKVVAWQHYGVWLSAKSNIYKSIHINKEQSFSQTINSKDVGSISNTIDVGKFRGKEIRFKAFIKCDVNNNTGNGNLWLRVVKENNQTGFSDDMQNRPILYNKWREYEIQGLIDEDAKSIVFGAVLKGYGKMWVDSVQIFIRNNKNDWEVAKVENPGFEEIESNKPKSWWIRMPGYKCTIDTIEKYEGKRSLFIEKTLPESVSRLFAKSPKIGDVIEKELIKGLYCRIPLALYSDAKGTLGKHELFLYDNLITELKKINLNSQIANDENVRLANVVISWNVLQHFYPYFDVVKVDWDKVLTETLKKTLKDKTANDFYDTLRKMIAKLNDGHGYVYYTPNPPLGGLPIKVDWIENKVVVTASNDTIHFKKGDIIRSIDGKSGEKELLLEEEFVSGSLQLRRHRALNNYGFGQIDSYAKIEILRDDKIIKHEFKREKETRGFFFNQISEFDFPDFKKNDNGIFYINLSSIRRNIFIDNISQLSNAKGIIFDFRYNSKQVNDYKNQLQLFEIIPYLVDTPSFGARLYVPQIIYPERKEITFAELQHSFKPEPPYFKSKIIFIINPSVISYGESFMAPIEFNKIAETVGEATAGCNGNANWIPLMGGYEIMFTGMKVLKPDGSQHHLIGIQPTYPVQRTIRAVKEGRDEYLEKAVEVIKKSIK